MKGGSTQFTWRHHHNLHNLVPYTCFAHFGQRGVNTLTIISTCKFDSWNGERWERVAALAEWRRVLSCSHLPITFNVNVWIPFIYTFVYLFIFCIKKVFKVYVISANNETWQLSVFEVVWLTCSQLSISFPNVQEISNKAISELTVTAAAGTLC